jgi:magnesium-transporting ATPase (P-type)
LISSDTRVISLENNPSMKLNTAAVEFFAREISLAESNSHQQLALLVDDHAVDAIKSFHIEKEFLELCHICQTVLCARISPKQKEIMVEMVRVYYPDKITMAIGDGANDVPMIQRAHIGIGITGEEGNQAADSSDYSIPTFRHLERLILVHGQWMNRRTSYLTLYIFYKNVLFVLPQFVYGAFCLYSGQSTYFDTLLQVYNICFTSLPILIFSVMDKDISAKTLLSFPKLYKDGYLHTFLNMKVFVFWMIEASIASILITFVPIYLMPFVPWTSNGQLEDIWSLGLVQYFAVVFLASLRLLLDVSSHFKYVVTSIIASLAFWWFVSFVLSSSIMFSWEFYGVLSHTGVVSLWLCTLFCAVTGIALSFLLKAFVVSFSPYPRTICRELDLFANTLDGQDFIKKNPNVVVHVNRES